MLENLFGGKKMSEDTTKPEVKEEAAPVVVAAPVAQAEAAPAPPEAPKGIIGNMGEEMKKQVFQKAFQDLIKANKLRIREDKGSYIVIDLLWDTRKDNAAYGTFVLGGEYYKLFKEEFVNGK